MLTCDPVPVRDFWLHECAPEALDTEARRYPAIADLAAGLGGATSVVPLPVPLDRSDGFNEACYGRPEGLLEAGARLSCSAWGLVDEAVHERFSAHLSRDLADGTRDRRFEHLRGAPELEGSLALVEPPPDQARLRPPRGAAGAPCGPPGRNRTPHTARGRRTSRAPDGL